jgi:fucose permease
MSYDRTRWACYWGYVTQAIVNMLAPVLFVVFHNRFDLPMEMLGRLSLLNFLTQLVTDVAAVRFIRGWGYRTPLVLAHALAAFGLVLLGFLPGFMHVIGASPYAGLCIAVVIYGVGGGLLEVLVSPLVDALPTPTEKKAAIMSLLHSFYCWGQVGIVLVTTLLLAVIGHGLWWVLPVIWAILPLMNMGVLMKVPMPEHVPEEQRTKIGELLRRPAFAAAMMLMFFTGAAELTISPWSSLFAQNALGIEKVTGDLSGPCLFAVFMGSGRMIFGLWGDRIPLAGAMFFCGILATLCYLVTSLASAPVVSLLACASCVFAVSLLWPGTFSMASRRFPFGGATMFGLLAVFGDGGAALGPWLAGALAGGSRSASGLKALANWLPADGESGLRVGMFICTLFPVLLTIVAGWWGLAGRRTRAGSPPLTADSLKS